MKRLGRVVFDLGYVVDLDNEEMVEDAKTCIAEDIMNAFKYGEVEQYIELRPEADAKEEDIPEFLLEFDEDRRTEETDNGE